MRSASLNESADIIISRISTCTFPAHRMRKMLFVLKFKTFFCQFSDNVYLTHLNKSILGYFAVVWSSLSYTITSYILKARVQQNQTQLVVCMVWFYHRRPANKLIPLQWLHNGRDGVSSHQPHDCLLNRLFKAQIKEKHKSSASLAFVWGIYRSPVNSPHKGPVTRKMFPFDDVIMMIHCDFKSL